MQTGEIVIVSFLYTNLINYKARPAVVVTQTKDNYNDVVVCLITSKVFEPISELQILLQPDLNSNLKASSLIRISRIATIKQNKILANIDKFNQNQLKEFKKLFTSLVD